MEASLQNITEILNPLEMGTQEVAGENLLQDLHAAPEIANIEM
jgi:hypothetical protein